MLTIKAIEGQSLWDVCLNTYGSFDYMLKLLKDNNIANANVYPYSGQSFVWDETLTADQAISFASQNGNIIYATKAIKNGSILSTVLVGSGTGPTVTGNPYYEPSNPDPTTMVKYQQTAEVQYIAAGGETSFTPLDGSGNAILKNTTIVQITRVIRPMLTGDFSLNPNTGTISLLNGIVLDPEEMLFTIYGKIITQ